MIDENQIEEIYSLNPSGMVQLFELDLGEILDDEISVEESVFHFYNGNDFNYREITWNNITFQALPSEALEFGMDTSKPPRPKIKIANIKGLIGQLLQEIQIEGATLSRYVIPIKYLPDSNFKNNNNPWGESPQGDLFEPSIYIVERKISENPSEIEYELSIPFDLEEVKLPSIQVMGNFCPHSYRGEACGYKGCMMTDKRNNSLISVSPLKPGHTLYHTTYFSNNEDVYYYEWQPEGGTQEIAIDHDNRWTVLSTHSNLFRKITDNTGEFRVWVEGEEYLVNDIVKVIFPNGSHCLQKCLESHTSEKPNKSYSNFELWARDYCNKTPQACHKRFGSAIPFGGIIGASNLPFK